MALKDSKLSDMQLNVMQMQTCDRHDRHQLHEDTNTAGVAYRHSSSSSSINTCCAECNEHLHVHTQHSVSCCIACEHKHLLQQAIRYTPQACYLHADTP